MSRTWTLTPLDTLFFRGADPFVAGESVYLESLFPPTPRTIQGMIRTALLEEHCIDLRLFSQGGCARCPVVKTCAAGPVVGTPDAIGTLRIRGPYLFQRDPRGDHAIYVAPRDLRQRGRADAFVRLAPGSAVFCDEGKEAAVVRLPQPEDGRPDLGSELEWLTEEGLGAYLRGAQVATDHTRATADLVDPEPRVGIARDAATRVARDQMLYSIVPLRLRAGVSLWIGVDGGDIAVLQTALGLRRLGGEGRLITVEDESGVPALPDLDAAARAAIQASGRLRLLLLQPADFEGGWLPRGFRKETSTSSLVWRGTVQGVALRIVVSCGGPPVAIGGWDLARGQPSGLRPCVPAGTVYYCELEQPFDVNQVVSQLHDSTIGFNTPSGFGHVAVGVWNG